ncbi:MAG: hypothetical protein RDU89_07115 [bacterium]|nr:hypothetical protein [bacterium]
MDHHLLRRLAFIKYLHSMGVSQSRAPAPLRCASVLTFHDAVELFLQLASEYHNVGASHPNFMEYWVILNEKLPSELAGKETMRRLNKVRVLLKHHGTLPSDLDIEAFRASTASFFLDNTPLVFELDYESVSMIEYVNPDTSRTLLREAQDATAADDIPAALGKIGLAYAQVFDHYAGRTADRFSRAPSFFSNRPRAFADEFSWVSDPVDPLRPLARFVNATAKSIDEMRETLKVVVVGVDYGRYLRFKNLVPYAVRLTDGRWHVYPRRYDPSAAPSEADAAFAVDFVVECALALAQFEGSFCRDAS